jgi:pyruvyltransferase
VSRVVRAFWWKGKPNFGDRLTPLLLERFARIEVQWALPKDADIIMVGSILEAVPHMWNGIICGTGKMYEHTQVHLPRANILALRGPLSAHGVPGNYAIGDAALLANELVAVEKRYNLGIVPHWSDKGLERRHEFKSFSPRIIRPDGDPLEVLREIGRCRKIVSSSLHGIIVADAFGIGRRTELAPQLKKEGGLFKFRDHSAAVGVEFELGVVQHAPRYIVSDLQQRMYDVLEGISGLVA